jgi:hypothetical protein
LVTLSQSVFDFNTVDVWIAVKSVKVSARVKSLRTRSAGLGTTVGGTDVGGKGVAVGGTLVGASGDGIGVTVGGTVGGGRLVH